MATGDVFSVKDWARVVELLSAGAWVRQSRNRYWICSNQSTSDAALPEWPHEFIAGLTAPLYHKLWDAHLLSYCHGGPAPLRDWFRMPGKVYTTPTDMGEEVSREG